MELRSLTLCCADLLKCDEALMPDGIRESYQDTLMRCGFRKLSKPRDATTLSVFYSQVPFRYPALFEDLCLSYYWADPVVGDIEFARNPVGDDLQGLASSVRYDSLLWDFLVAKGYLIFGRMSGGRYDPCAFDTRRRTGSDAPVVRVDHEEILSFQRLGQPTLLARSFKELLDSGLAVDSRGRTTKS